jgi:hypothetical protein
MKPRVQDPVSPKNSYYDKFQRNIECSVKIPVGWVNLGIREERRTGMGLSNTYSSMPHI